MDKCSSPDTCDFFSYLTGEVGMISCSRCFSTGPGYQSIKYHSGFLEIIIHSLKSILVLVIQPKDFRLSSAVRTS